jgi:RNA polymerase sigma-70 factor (ECF subfamily)
MLGSLQDAEEIVQDALFRAWQRQDEVREAGAVRSWLYKIATNACLDQLLKARRRRALPHLIAPSSIGFRLGSTTEPERWIEPVPDALLDPEDSVSLPPDDRISQRESVGLAFVTALQLLSPKQRAALLLVDVLGWKTEETAQLLEASAFSVNSLLQRARKSIEEHRNSAQPRVASADVALLGRFITAWESGDLEAFTAMLAEDALLSMPPQPEWYAGREAVSQFFGAVWAAVPGQRRLLQVTANAGLAVAVYNRPPAERAAYQASAIMLVEMRGGLVAQLTRFAFPRLFSMFGLASELISD